MLEAEKRLVKEYSGRSGNWSQGRQKMEVDDRGTTRLADVHYFYEPSVGDM